MAQIGVASRPAMWEFISTIELASAAATIGFSGIETKFTQLRITGRLRLAKAAAANAATIQFNGDSTATNYFERYFYGATTAISTAGGNDNNMLQITANSAAAGRFTMVDIVISNLTGQQSEVLSRCMAFDTAMIIGGHWTNTDKITAILFEILGPAADWMADCRLTLWGMQK